MPRTAKTVWILVALVLGLAAPARAVIVMPGPATQAALEAQKLASDGRESEAEARLQRALGQCPPAREGAACRVQLGFAAGTLAELRAASDPAGRAQWLGGAAARYEAVLADSPAHAAALGRLSRLYLQQGDRTKATSLLDDALKRFPDEEAIALLLGDLQRDVRQWDEAVAAYRHAMDRHPTSDPPRRRLVQLYAGLLPARLDDLRGLLAELERGFPAIAEVGHRAIIAQLHRSNPGAAEASLVQLVGVLASTRRLGAQSFDTLPPGWTPPALGHLRAYLAAPQRRPPSGWWLDRPERRHVLALGGLALGNQSLVESDPAGAAARWEVAEDFAPEYEAYTYPPLKGLPVVRLDLETALALHYFKFPSLDPGERKFNRVINAIFQSKAGAYQLDDLEGIQRHHTILGIIFAQKGEWKTGHFALNAIFQLDNALKTAARRDAQDGSYQPLPELRAQLAQGYAKTGDVARARATYLAAAQAYLDTDALEPAGETLRLAGPLMPEGASAEREQAGQLTRVLGTRADVAQAAGPRLDPAAGEYAFRSDGAHAWLYGQPLAALPPVFVDRQRFKTLSDLAVRIGEAGHAPASAELGTRALRIAIDSLKQLTGPADVVRLEKLRPVALQQRVLDQRPLVLGGFKSRPAGGKTWKLTDPVALRPTEVWLDGDDVLAVRIVQELRADPALPSTDFVVTGGRVMVQAGARSDEARLRIEKMAGVDAVQVAPGLPARPQGLPSRPTTKK
jgi:tetratricopeptide (TPR) repeat protein